MKRLLHMLYLVLSWIPMMAQQSIPIPSTYNSETDSIIVTPDSITDSPDSVEPTVTEQKKEAAIDAKIEYTSSDSMVITGNGIAYMYGSGDLKYKSMELTADYIRVHMDSSTLYAKGVYDTIENEWVGKPVFSEGNDEYETDELTYNLRTQKGLILNAITEQGEGYILAGKTKKVGDDVLMLAAGKYTTCDQHDHPHFYLHMTKAKVKPGDYIATGPAYLVVGDVPLPLAIPFGFFPFTSKYSSGLIMPNFGDDYTRGLYLSGLGYYFAINDYMDLQITGDIYTRGTWAVSARSRYLKRYKFNGSISVSYRWDVTGEKDMPDYNVAKNLQVQWTHTQDAKANPYNNFSASVNFKTAGYNRSNINSYYNVQANAENTTSSSISYTQRFPDSPWNIGLNMSITQRNKDSTLAVTLPSLTVSMSRIYPFKRKVRVGKEKWYEKISFQYTGRLTNSINTKDNLILKQGLDKWNNGMQHTIPVSATFTLFKYFNVVPSFNYTERWYTRKVLQSYDPTVAGSIRKDTINGFNRLYNYNMSLQVNSKLYGFFKPWKVFGDKVQMIRHVFTPSVSFSYAPDFGQSRYGYYDTYTYTDEKGEVRTVEYSPYQGMAFGVPGKGMQKSFNFAIDNNVEMKIKSDSDTTGVKKISLIDQLSANMSYNAAAQTRPWSDLSMNLRLKLTKSYTFNMNASFATYAYQYDDRGNIVVGDRTEWSYGRFGRFQGYSGSFSYTFNNDTWKKWFGSKDDEGNNTNGKNDDKEGEYDDEYISEEEQEALKKKQSQPRKKEKANISDDGYMAFKMPWSLSLSYSYSIREDRNKEKFNRKTMRYPYALTHSLNASGNVKLGSRWNINYSSGYDFTQKKMSMTTVNITRDLHCFTMSCGLVFGPFTSYNFSIRALSSMLTDALKWDQRSNTGSAVTWY